MVSKSNANEHVLWIHAVEHHFMTFCDFSFSLRLDGKHVVFGQVVEGLDIIRKVEGYGSSSGKTSATIVIADCGQL